MNLPGRSAVMIQGTGSNVGKSVLVAGIARVLTQRGMRARPFKPQNMSNNAAVTADGGEIGRAQALQARACGVDPITDMNPVLLKPEAENGSQVILHGRRLTTIKAREYSDLKPKLMQGVLDSYRRLAADADIVLIEGAGSPAEINLRAGDIANMGFAEAANVPVVLAGCIDRGGVIAQVVGTHAVLTEADRSRIKAFLVNKFRGDPALFDDGYSAIVAATGWSGLGVIPWFSDAGNLPAEDAADIRQNTDGRHVRIACPVMSRIANFDDLDPLKQAPGVSVTMVRPGEPLPGDSDLVILPGTKSTRGDLDFLREQGWDIDLKAHVRRGGQVLGICGGYQMLGRAIHDPEGIEGPVGSGEGLGLLDVETVMTPDKALNRVSGKDLRTGQALEGYEIHIGRTDGPDCARPVVEIDGRPHGATSRDGRVKGLYLHGLFASDAFRTAWLEALGAPDAGYAYDLAVEDTLDALAVHLETHLDIDALLDIARTG